MKASSTWTLYVMCDRSHLPFNLGRSTLLQIDRKKSKKKLWRPPLPPLPPLGLASTGVGRRGAAPTQLPFPPSLALTFSYTFGNGLNGSLTMDYYQLIGFYPLVWRLLCPFTRWFFAALRPVVAIEADFHIIFGLLTGLTGFLWVNLGSLRDFWAFW